MALMVNSVGDAILTDMKAIVRQTLQSLVANFVDILCQPLQFAFYPDLDMGR
ncbi:MAG: hypothetical protein SQA66_15315 [Candidatus Fervidibacter sacchari]